jgi:pyridoxal phosphate enzyme (YggS family)
MIQSMDSLRLAREINRCAARHNLVMPVLVELNVAREETKSGIAPEELEDLIRQASGLSHIRIRGLMAIPPHEGDPERKEGYFDTIHRHFIDIKAKKIDNVCMDILSMGMTEDYHLAIRHGSNLIRVGRAIFGERL